MGLQRRAAQVKPSPRRVVQLDSLRGVAAATVVWHHWRLAFQDTLPPWYLVPFVAGREAVILFFVLSGYVLTLPVWTGKQPGYAEYLARRVGRIYFPYAAAALLAAVGCYFFWGAQLPLTTWFYETWQTPLSGKLIFDQLLMDPHPFLNTAFWSLRYEMEMSLIFPFLCLLMLKGGRYSGVVLVVLLKMISFFVSHGRFGASDLAATCYYSVFFVAGAALSRERGPVERFVGSINVFALTVALIVASGVYFYSRSIVKLDRIADSFVGVAVCVIIVLIQDCRLNFGLESRFAEYLGRVSYSSYLTHGTVLFVLLNLFYQKVPTLLLALMYAGCTLIVTHLFCVSVEEPSHRLGRRVGRWMRDGYSGDVSRWLFRQE